MDPEQKFRLKWLTFFLVVTLVVVVTMPQPAAALPPRPEGDRDSFQSGSDGHSDGGGLEASAFIELYVRAPQPGLQAVVQWLEDSGEWIEVEGWSGLVEENRPVLWWVNKADFGKGPFRWAVYTGSSETKVLTSDEFYLPRQAGETLTVRMIVLPTPTLSPSPTTTPPPGVESVPAAVTTTGSQPRLQERYTPSAFTPTPQAAPVPMFSATPAPGPTFTPAVTPPGPSTPLVGPTSTPFPPAASDPATVELVHPTPSHLVEAASEEVAIAKSSAVSLVVNQSVSPAAAPGQVITWSFSVGNPTTLAAEEIILSDVLPAELVYVGGRTSHGRIELAGNREIVLVKLGSIPAGTQAQVEIFTQVPAGIEPGTVYSNVATYSSFNFGAGVSNTAQVVANEEERVGGFLVPAAVLEKGVWGSAILVFGALTLIGVRRVRNRHQTRRQEQVA